ncbi:MAG TPA: cellulase family glycosylhydrolase [Candidatus Limnocylindrales bacterium]|nr:cellulase family glycosylhydrolase [Candidatus Limnocylindrales bacterium]
MKLIGWFLFVPFLCAASELPPPILPQGVGVNIHFVSGHQRDLDLIAAAGFKFVRMDFGWTGIERKKGEYDWGAYDELTANLEKRGLRPVFILDYSNPLYEASVTSPNPITQQTHTTLASPQHPESIAAYAGWGAAAATHFTGHHIIWEIWNEPNIDFWAPKPDAQQYSALALAVCRAIRAVEPQATIVGPAASGFPWEFMKTFFQSGVLDYLDAVSVHPYRDYRRAPETAAEDYKKLRALIDQYASESRKGKIPILSGEWGYATHTKGISLDTQAAFAARQQLANLLFDVPLSIWYDWKNDGPDPAEREHNFGTVTADLQPKPAYLAIQTLTRQLSGFRISRRLPVGDEHDFILLCADDAGKQAVVGWCLAEPHTVRIEVTVTHAADLTGVKSDGTSFHPKADSDSLVLELSTAPQYVKLEEKAIVR